MNSPVGRVDRACFVSVFDPGEPKLPCSWRFIQAEWRSTQTLEPMRTLSQLFTIALGLLLLTSLGLGASVPVESIAESAALVDGRAQRWRSPTGRAFGAVRNAGDASEAPARRTSGSTPRQRSILICGGGFRAWSERDIRRPAQDKKLGRVFSYLR